MIGVSKFSIVIQYAGRGEPTAVEPAAAAAAPPPPPPAPPPPHAGAGDTTEERMVGQQPPRLHHTCTLWWTHPGRLVQEEQVGEGAPTATPRHPTQPTRGGHQGRAPCGHVCHGAGCAGAPPAAAPTCASRWPASITRGTGAGVAQSAWPGCRGLPTLADTPSRWGPFLLEPLQVAQRAVHQDSSLQQGLQQQHSSSSSSSQAAHHIHIPVLLDLGPLSALFGEEERDPIEPFSLYGSTVSVCCACVWCLLCRCLSLWMATTWSGPAPRVQATINPY